MLTSKYKIFSLGQGNIKFQVPPLPQGLKKHSRKKYFLKPVVLAIYQPQMSAQTNLNSKQSKRGKKKNIKPVFKYVYSCFYRNTAFLCAQSIYRFFFILIQQENFKIAPCFAHGERQGRVYKSQQFTVSLILCAQKRIRFKVQKKGGVFVV